MNKNKPFWQDKSLLEMSHDEWESICDGCAKCCLTQLQDEETDLLVFTDVACNLLDDETCQCTSYDQRSTKVPSCITMNRDNVHEVAEFAPPTCSYRLLLAGEDLPDWHHLNTESKTSIHESGNSVRHRVRFERDIDPEDIQEYVIDWA